MNCGLILCSCLLLIKINASQPLAGSERSEHHIINIYGARISECVSNATMKEIKLSMAFASHADKNQWRRLAAEGCNELGATNSSSCTSQLMECMHALSAEYFGISPNDGSIHENIPSFVHQQHPMFTFIESCEGNNTMLVGNMGFHAYPRHQDRRSYASFDHELTAPKFLCSPRGTVLHNAMQPTEEIFTAARGGLSLHREEVCKVLR